MSEGSVLVVVQRYGDVSGGAEAHARMVATRLRPHLDVEVATTTAADYWTWENAFPAGESVVDGIRVHRFPVARGRRRDFRRYERAAFSPLRTLADERAFLDAQGPVAPELLEFVHGQRTAYDSLLFFTYIYQTTAYGLPLAAERAVLVPTAHDEPALALATYRALFHAPRAIVYNTEEERAMVQRRFRNARIPSEVLGVGVDVPEGADAERFRARHGISGPLFLYVGRVVESKGMPELFALWSRWRDGGGPRATLVVAGDAEMAVPKRDDVRYLGRISDQEKFDALAACTALVIPSPLESLSIVTLEAWAMGKPSVCAARSAVLAGMTRRAGGGLAYRGYGEFAEILELLLERHELAASLGASGKAFVERTYSWPRIVETYRDVFAEVRARLD
jgi:glycosyltransferase involved in cell wall biosynthesis